MNRNEEGRLDFMDVEKKIFDRSIDQELVFNSIKHLSKNYRYYL
jgi:hypothetical protein